MHLGNQQPVILASQIYNKGFRPKAGAQPVEMWTNGYCGQTAMYYWISDLEPASAKEIAKHQQEDRERRNSRARELYHWHKAEERRLKEEQEAERKRLEEAYANGDLPLKTSWQWLSQDHRIPKDNAVAIGKTYKYYWDYGQCDYHTWYYYPKKDTVPVDEAEYQRLKALYIKKFGGWNCIDLDNTTYTGKKWW